MNKNNRLTIAFDMLGTLVATNTSEDQQAMIFLIKRLKKAGHKIIVWTGGFKQDAERAVFELGLKDFVDECIEKVEATEIPDIAFDDDKFTCQLASKATILV